MSLLDNLPHKCTIQRRRNKSAAGTALPMGLGGSKNKEAVEQTNVECWQQPASAREISDYEKRGQTVDTKVYFTSDPNVTPRHQILVTEKNGVAVTSPAVLDVVAADPDASAGLGVLFKVMCNEHRTEDT